MGIPMGANYSPNLANLYLHYYESKFMHIQEIESRLSYNFMFRYIDDLLVISNNLILTEINKIYPPFLEIKNTNDTPHRKCSFLDIDIEIINGNVNHKVYDKRRDYDFEILGLPSFNSNIPSHSTYGVLCSQLYRYASICKYRDDFLYNCQLFINKLKQNNFPTFYIKKIINKFDLNKNLTISKFNLNSKLIYALKF